MLFNSLSFSIFLPVVFILYWFVFKRSFKAQNIMLLICSYYFYGAWDYRFLFLLMFSTALDYFSGIMISEAKTKKLKLTWLWISIGINLGFLGFFKYYNFFIVSFAELLSNFGLSANVWTLQIILPVGISFYTFHGLSYVIDIYYDRIVPERNVVNYSLFVSYFPLLVAGPIERATHLLPQLQKERKFEFQNATDGLKQILWGLFKKIVIADNCAEYANLIFNNSSQYSGSTLLLGAFFFAVQIYGDFSGYSDIALGSSRLLGIELLRNFNFPYFSRDIAEFWRRWHISLSTWFRDYLYFPLGGSRVSTAIKVRNTFIIFLVSGFWHGANWTFIAWGLLNALYFMPLLLTSKNRVHLEIVAQEKLFPTFRELRNMIVTFFLVNIAWVFFRAESLNHAFHYLGTIFSRSLFTVPNFRGMQSAFITLALVVFFFFIEWLGREHKYALSNFGAKWHWTLRWFFFAFLIFLMGMYMTTEETPFIYFQF